MSKGLFPEKSPAEARAPPSADHLEDDVDRNDHDVFHYDAEETAKVLHKIDYRLLPTLALLYLLTFLDKGNIGNARVAGMAKDLHLTGTQYNIALTLFFIPYAIFEVPSNIVLKLLRPSIWIAILVVLWGTCCACTGVVTSYHSLLVVRILLGLCEAGFFPAATFLVIEWYCRFEVQTRLSVFFSAASMAGAFSGLLAYAIQHMDGLGNLAGWQWILILEGAITIAVGIAVPFVLPDSPERARWLTPEEQVFIRRRLELDSGTEKGRVETLDHFHSKYLIAAISDWKLWFTVFIYWGNTIPVYAFTFTAPTIILELGYTSYQAQLLTIPVYTAGLIATIGFSWLADRYKSRWPFVVIPYGISMMGFLGLLVIPHPKYPGLTYAFLFPITIGVYPAVITLVSWVANNLAPTSKRACGLAVSIMMGNFGGAIGSNIYLTREAPHYWTGYGVSLTCSALAIICTFILRWAYKRENEKRDQMSEEEIRAKYSEQELLEMGDKSPLYRYVTCLTRPKLVDCRSPSRKSPPEGSYQSYSSTEPRAPHMRTEKLRYLKTAGAFDVPRVSTTKVLLEAFINSVYPFFPVLDLRRFLKTTLLFRAYESEPDVSFLLFHSVLAAGLAHVDPAMFKEAEGDTRDEFREILLGRVKALYNMEHERDQLALCSSLILMSIAFEDPDHPDECRKWLSLAWNCLESSSLMDSASGLMNTSPNAAIWRRNWWACYTQDRRLSIATRRPVLHSILADEVRQVSTEDFEVRRHAAVILEAFSSVPMLGSTDLQTEAIRMCIANNELYTHLDSILLCKDVKDVTFCRGPWSWGPYQCRQRQWLLRRAFLSHEECCRRLFEWVWKYPTYVLRQHSLAHSDRSLRARCIELQIVSTSALSLLICSQSLKPGSKVPSQQNQKTASRLMQTATDITEAFFELGDQGLLNCVGPSILQHLMPAAALHANPCCSQQAKSRTVSLQSLRRCAAIFNSLRNAYPSARTCGIYLEAIIDRLGSFKPQMDAEIEKSASSVGVPFQSDLRARARTAATLTSCSSAIAPLNAGATDTQNASLTKPSSLILRDEGTTFNGKTLLTPESHIYQEGTEMHATSDHSYSDQSDSEIEFGPGKYNPTSDDYTALLLWHSTNITTGSTESTTPNTFDDIGELKYIEPRKLMFSASSLPSFDGKIEKMGDSRRCEENEIPLQGSLDPWIEQ
ncbi:hypothetical protein PV11_08459 [Exophiala sideris]|uniref:Major facilitator superfamily (MFS) profile domain-containing protein n=1 Tax=Exophiala sideris TaxID=1016849 RepID=A0A0D1VXH7_9EURO|nr:hypothetical protein PV11_08459 [Exophiala sideris]